MDENDETLAAGEQIGISARQQIDPSFREQIEQRAYEIYLQRGGADGNDMADWLSAEEELTRLAQAPIDSPVASITYAQSAVFDADMARAEALLRDLYERSRAIAARAGS